MNEQYIYALYRGEDNICDGTLREIAEQTGKTYNEIINLKHRAAKRKHRDNNHYDFVVIGRVKK